MKIAFLLTQSLESPSGLGRFGPLARQMVARGHEVEVYALHPNFTALSHRCIVDSGVRVTYVSQMHVQKRGSAKTYFGPGELLRVTLAATLRLTMAVYRSKAEIIQVCKPHPMNTLAARLARSGRPVYYDCDDYEARTNVFTGTWQRRVVAYFEDNIVQDAAGLTVNTCFMAQHFAGLGYPPEKIIYVPNGVESTRFIGPFDRVALRRRLNIPLNAPLILYAGTLGLLSHPVDLLLEAFPLVLRDLPSAHLLLVGGGEDYDVLRNMAVNLGISDRAIFTGRIPAGEVPEYLAAADVSVDPVLDDEIARARSPLKIFESLAVGTPVVTSPVGDRAALFGDIPAGLLAAPGDPASLAKSLLEVLESEDLRQHVRQKATFFRDHWSWSSLVKTFEQVYNLGR